VTIAEACIALSAGGGAEVASGWGKGGRCWVEWFAGHGEWSGVRLINECLSVNDVQLTIVCLYLIQRDVIDFLNQANILVRFVGEQMEEKAARLD
jgi:hypothetical protein